MPDLQALVNLKATLGLSTKERISVEVYFDRQQRNGLSARAKPTRLANSKQIKISSPHLPRQRFAHMKIPAVRTIFPDHRKSYAGLRALYNR